MQDHVAFWCAAIAPLMLTWPVYGAYAAAFLVALGALWLASYGKNTGTLVLAAMITPVLYGFAIVWIGFESATWALFADGLTATSILGISLCVTAYAIGNASASNEVERYRMINLVALTWGSAYLISALVDGGFARYLLRNESDGLVALAIIAAGIVSRTDRDPFPRFVGSASVGIAALILFHTLVGVPGLSPVQSDAELSMEHTYAIVDGVLAEGGSVALFGVGPGGFADAWNQYRPIDLGARDLPGVEPRKGHSLMLTILIEHGLVMLVACIGAVVWILNRATAGGIVLAVASVAAIVAYSPTFPALVALSLALGIATDQHGSVGLRYQRFASVVSIAVFAPMATLIGAMMLCVAVYAHILSEKDFIDLAPGRAAAYIDTIAPASLPFGVVRGARVALWQSYLSSRIARGESLIVESDGVRHDLIAGLFSSIRDADRIRSGARLALQEAQMALWLAEQGDPSRLGDAYGRLSALLEEAPLNVVARELRARIRAASGLQDSGEDARYVREFGGSGE